MKFFFKRPLHDFVQGLVRGFAGDCSQMILQRFLSEDPAEMDEIRLQFPFDMQISC